MPYAYERNTEEATHPKMFWAAARDAVMCTKKRFVILLKMTVGFWSPHVVESLQLAQLANDFDATDKSGRLELGDWAMNPSPDPKATDKPKWKVQQKIVKWRFLEWSTRPEEPFYGQLAFEPPFKGKVAVLKYDENKFAKRITDARNDGATAIIVINKKKFAGVEKKRPDAVAEMPPDKKPWCCFCRAADKKLLPGKESPDEEKDAADEELPPDEEPDAAVEEPPPDKELDKQPQRRRTRLGQLTRVVDDVFVLMVSYNEGQVMKKHAPGTWLMLEGESSRRETQMHC